MDLGRDISGTCCPPFGVQKICLAWTGNALKTGKMTRKMTRNKKKVFLEKHYFDHLPPCGFGDYIINVWS